LIVQSPNGGAQPRRSVLPVSLALLAALLLSGVAMPTLAHGGAPRLIVSPDPIQPGAVVEVRGEDLGADVEVRIQLQGAAGEAEIGTALPDGQGHLTVFVPIPADAPVGMYAINARSDAGGMVARSPLQVAGSPIVANEEMRRDEDEPLLAPLGQSWLDAVSSHDAAAAQLEAPAAPSSDPSGLIQALLPLAGLVVLVGLALVWVRHQRGSPA
jgi:hypothetical protein